MTKKTLIGLIALFIGSALVYASSKKKKPEAQTIVAGTRG